MSTRNIIVSLTLIMGLASMAVAASVQPTLYDPWQSGDAAFECSQVECCDAEFAYKWNEDPDNEGPLPPPLDYPAEGAPNGTILLATGNTITISNSDGYSFDWTSDWPVCCVIVKGGPSANVYCYEGGSYGDTELFAPTNPNNNKPYEISHVTFCYNELGVCWEEETAWAEGEHYVKKGNWAMYVEYEDGTIVDLIADGGSPLTAKIIGTATFSAPQEQGEEDDFGFDGPYVEITITLTGAIFYYDLSDPLYDDNLKVQDYAKAPTKTPSPGKFAWKTRIEPGSTSGSIVVPLNNFYGVHLDVAVPVPCEEQQELADVVADFMAVVE